MKHSPLLPSLLLTIAFVSAVGEYSASASGEYSARKQYVPAPCAGAYASELAVPRLDTATSAETRSPPIEQSGVESAE